MISPYDTRLIAPLREGWVQTGDIRHDALTFLTVHGLPETAAHVADVAKVAKHLAARFGEDTAQIEAETAAWLHDISAVFPNETRIAAAEAFGLITLPEERAYPMIVHQQLSAVLTRELFHIRDPATLAAIACHTTLKAGATRLDTIVFIADKIAWDQPGVPPYLPALTHALEHSLDAAAFVYLDWLWQQRETLRVIHPWFRDAYMERAFQA